MPSFDIVSEVDNHELSNAIDQANRELTVRFDFKGVNASFTLNDGAIELLAPTDFQLKQMQDILNNKLSKRHIDLKALELGKVETNLSQAKQKITVKQGIESDVGKKIIKFIKDNKFKVQSAMQDKQIRVTGKKRDDLQAVIAQLKAEDFNLPLQYQNFRD